MLKIDATHLFLPTESSSGYVGPSMGPRCIFSKLHATLRTDQEKVGCQGNHPKSNAYYVYRGYMHQAPNP